MNKMILIFSLFAIASFSFLEASRDESKAYLGEVAKLRNSIMEIAHNEYGLMCVGAGGALMDRINHISLIFKTEEFRKFKNEVRQSEMRNHF